MKPSSVSVAAMSARPSAGACPQNAQTSRKRQRDRPLLASIAEADKRQVLDLDPTRILTSPWHHRSSLNFAGGEFETLIAEVRRRGGNEIPILVRTVKDAVGASNDSHATPGDSAGQLQLVYGHRRLRACALAGVPVRAIKAELDDRQAVEALVAENSHRADTSAWEHGHFYLQLQARQLYPSLTSMAKALGRDKGDVSRAMSLARLPQEVIAAVADPRTLALHDGSAIRGALQRDKPGTLETVRALVKAEGPVSARRLVEAVASKAEPNSGQAKADRSFSLIQVDGRDVAELSFTGRGKLVLKITYELAPDQVQRATGALTTAVTAIFSAP